MKPMRIMSSVLKRRTFAVAITVFAMAAVAILLSSGFTSANDVKIVRGYTRDSAANPLEGTNVVIEIRTPLNALRFTDSYTSDETGFYSFTLVALAGQWSDGDTIKIIANYEGNEETVTVADDGNAIQWIDVTFPFEIPQFGSLLGFSVAAGGIGLIAMVFLVRRKKD